MVGAMLLVPMITRAAETTGVGTAELSSQQVVRIRANVHKLTIGDTRTEVYAKLGVSELNMGIGSLSSAVWDLTTHRLTDQETLILSFDRYGAEGKLRCAVIGSAVVSDGFRFGAGVQTNRNDKEFPTIERTVSLTRDVQETTNKSVGRVKLR